MKMCIIIRISSVLGCESIPLRGLPLKKEEISLLNIFYENS